MKYFSVLLLVAWPAFAADSMPFETKDCGTIGNVLAIASHVRDEGMSLAAWKLQAAAALQGCIVDNGAANCSIRNKSQQEWVDAAFAYLWANPEVDGTAYATRFYTDCTARANKPS